MNPSMIAIQTWALFVDAFRELNHRKLFWITMAINLFVVAASACFGISESGFTLLWWEFPMPGLRQAIGSTGEFYRGIFLSVGVGVWLSWAAIILGLISTASIFPDFLAGGSVDLWFSRPISRLRLLLTKYFFALLFVALQVAVFSLGAFVVMGVRGGLWAPGIFLAIPLVTAMFSYLFAFSVLFGVVTRSAITALLLTFGVWCVLFVFNMADSALLATSTAMRMELDVTERRIEFQERRSVPNEERLAQLRETLVSTEEALPVLDWWHGLVFKIKLFLPKTEETVALLERRLIPIEEIGRGTVNEPSGDAGSDSPPPEPGLADPSDTEIARRFETIRRERSVMWVLGTSFLFQAVILGIAAVIVVRRDY